MVDEHGTTKFMRVEMLIDSRAIEKSNGIGYHKGRGSKTYSKSINQFHNGYRTMENCKRIVYAEACT